ncbi:hypothetical protein OB2597_11806 [Pseudooceanicola batsensis HTCC2597]|uniref:SH3b domain-containing protein n=1 Tax=Pseudooceanicola batsensis (strain ATCC BAA-863 / DSM 15984 / KCTC 12145 / HTCC2597) TaxID=252305 RepID=A3TWD1_PSEBH|nr:SH3 domain-containing protein [Pseudooceanicola batsensis]EAQ03927.1 hypothetical protein OB2597_11806 [Pseudooceanicola batsensis HTCC2597]
MILRALVVLLFLSGGPVAVAEPFPALYDVVGVARDDVLNIRAEPDARAEILGTFAPDRRGVEVGAVSDDGGWGQVNAGGRSGWASLTYLERRDGQEDGDFPPVRRCLGTEPFWSLGQGAGRWRYETPGGIDVTMDETWRGRSSGRLDRFGVVMGRAGMRARMVVARQSCSDGMSDKAFWLTADILIERSDGEREMISGCCTISSR